MKNSLQFPLGLLALLTTLVLGCASSYQDSIVQDRLADYKAASKAYHETEEKYLDLLFNLERMPDDPYLLSQKKLLMADLSNLRAVMLQSRSELDDAVQRWEMEIKEERGVQGAGSFSPNAFSRANLWSSMNKFSSAILPTSSAVKVSSSSKIVLTMSSAEVLPRVDLISSSSFFGSSETQASSSSIQTP